MELKYLKITLPPLHKYIYNNIYTENIINLVNNLDYSYDLVLLIDVLEHFSKEEGLLLLNKLLKKIKLFSVIPPKKPSPQQDVFGNAFEIHKSLWKKKELSTLGKHYFIRDNISHIVYITREQYSLNNLISRTQNTKKV